VPDKRQTGICDPTVAAFVTVRLATGKGGGVRKKLRCYLGKHEWERREEHWEKYFACMHCGKRNTRPDKYVPPAPPGGHP